MGLRTNQKDRSMYAVIRTTTLSPGLVKETWHDKKGDASRAATEAKRDGWDGEMQEVKLRKPKEAGLTTTGFMAAVFNHAAQGNINTSNLIESRITLKTFTAVKRPVVNGPKQALEAGAQASTQATA